MTVSYGGASNFYIPAFSIEAPQSIEGGIIYTKKEKTEDSSNNNGNKILDFETGKYVDYNDYMLKDTTFDIKYFA